MAPLRGWAPRGQRLKAKVPHGRWKTMTFLAALRHDRLEAPWLIDGPINGERFRLYVEKVLVPTLKPGDIVILDNLGSHRGKAAPFDQPAQSSSSCQKTLPICARQGTRSGNPIEMLFSKLKHLLRKAAERNADAVCNAIGQILDSLTARECRNYFAQAGYDLT